MSKPSLKNVLTQQKKDQLCWDVSVPIGTNPFILLELFQLSFIGACVVVITIASGLWAVGGGLVAGDVTIILSVALVCLVALIGSFVLLGFLFYGNRYYSVYSFSLGGVVQESMRGHDASKERFYLRLKPYPVTGTIVAKKKRVQELPWEKVDRFVNFPSMRSIQLKRGRWHMLRLYTPSEKVHQQVVAYLATRLQEIHS